MSNNPPPKESKCIGKPHCFYLQTQEHSPQCPIYEWPEWKWEDVPKIEGLYIRPGRQKPSLAFMHKSAVALIPEFTPFHPDSDMEFRSLCSQKFAHAFYEANK